MKRAIRIFPDDADDGECDVETVDFGVVVWIKIGGAKTTIGFTAEDALKLSEALKEAAESWRRDVAQLYDDDTNEEGERGC